ncbi:MAG: HNH endonuclease [Sedimentisphaerales bacterium]|nr:HNH endonuclease [Sedimentisphaerales bacterium]
MSKPRRCEDCICADALQDGRRTLLICANTPEWPGQMVRVQRDGTCRRFRPKRKVVRGVPPEPRDDGIRYIPLTKGKVAIVDAADYEWLCRYKWQALDFGGRIYASRAAPGRGRLAMHRAIMRPPKGMVVDHINGNGLDNRRCNLRICTVAQNCANRRPLRNRASSYKGVSIRYNGKATAQIGCRGGILWLGTFDNEIEAAKAYDRKAYELHGEFAYLNFPDEIEGA